MKKILFLLLLVVTTGCNKSEKPKDQAVYP